jgi:Zn-dependent protease with chaperone function
MTHLLPVGLPALLMFASILLAPVIIAFWSRWLAFRTEENERAGEWVRRRRQISIASMAMLAAWWVLWDGTNVSETIRIWTSGWEWPAGLVSSAFFLIPPILTTALVRLIIHLSNTTFLDDRSRAWDLVRLTTWSTAAPATAQLLAARGFEALYGKSWWAAIWLLAALGVLPLATVRLRRAEGLKMRRVKSGEIYKRAFALARQMGVTLREVAVVPVGRGNLTNAYASVSRTVAITENYTAFLRGAQLDFVIGHELGHLRARHGLKRLGIMAVVFVVLIAACALLPRSLLALRPLLDVIILLAPVLINRCVSRQFEYAADRAGLSLTQNLEMACRALENLHRVSQAPTTCGWVMELLMSHPSLDRRIRALEAVDALQRASSV